MLEVPADNPLADILNRKEPTVKVISSAEKIRDYVRKHPKASGAEVAEAIGTTKQRVYTVMWQMKNKASVTTPATTTKKRGRPAKKKANWKPAAVVTTNTPMPVTMHEPTTTTERVEDHPLYAIFYAAIEQAMFGKGERHGGARTPFFEQPWAHYVRLHGRGFATGQAAKKLEEAATTRTGKPFEQEVFGAMVYLGMAVLEDRRREAELTSK